MEFELTTKKAWKWRAQTWSLLIIGFAVVLVALVASFAFSMVRPTTEVHIGQSGIYHLWVADTQEDLYQGLSGVEDLPRNGGLLMDFKAPEYPGIVMRDMNVPLDLVWLNESKEVVHIVKNVAADTDESIVFEPKKPAQYVLELPAGSVVNSAIRIGNRADFTLNGEVR